MELGLSLSISGIRASVYKPSLSFDWVNNPSLRSTVGDETISFTRATTRTVVDHEGMVRTILSGEAGFEGYRRVENKLGNTALAGTLGVGNTPTSWAHLSATGTWELVESSLGDGHNADHQTASTQRPYLHYNTTFTPRVGDIFVLSCIVESCVVAPVNQIFNIAQVGYTMLWGNAPPAVSSEPRRYSAAFQVSSVVGPIQFRFGLGVLNNDTGELTISHPQAELVTGSLNYNPSEYVSVGVLSSPYHGAGVDGVRYFTTYNPNTVTGNVVTETPGLKWLDLPGVASNIASTPDKASLDLTGDFEMRVRVATGDLTPAASEGIFGKSAYLLYKNGTNGNLVLRVTPDGGSNQFYSITPATLGWVENEAIWFKVTFDADDGAGNSVASFYTSTDGEEWTLKATDTDAAVALIDANLAALEVGAGGTGAFNGKIYYAEVRNGIDGEVVAAFDPSRAAALDTSFVAETGETWTVSQSGAAKAQILGGAIDPETTIKGFAWWEAVTNVCLQSEDFGTTWAVNGTPTRSAAAARCGDVVLDLLGDDDAAAVELYRQNLTFTGDGTKALSVYVKQGTATSSLFLLSDNTAVVDRLLAIITWSGGAPSLSVTAGTHEGTDALGNGVFRLRFTAAGVVAANTNQLQVRPAWASGTGAAETGNIHVGGVQAQNAARCGPYAKTTTASVTVNGDAPLLTPITAFFNEAEGTVVSEFLPNGLGAGVNMYVWQFSDGTTNERSLVHLLTGGGVVLFVGDGGVTQASISPGGGLVNGTIARVAAVYKANDFALSINGGAVATDSAGTVPTPTQLEFGRFAPSNNQHLNGHGRKFDYHPRRLPNAELERQAA